MEADARLIAAAPDLLEALDAITRCVSMAGPAGTTAYLISDERMQKARAAVARARGVLSSESLPQIEMTNSPTAPAICLTCGSEIDPRKFGLPLREALGHPLAAVRHRADLKASLDRYAALLPGERIRLAMAILWDVNEAWDDDGLEHYPEGMPSFDEYLAEIGSKLYEITWHHE